MKNSFFIPLFLLFSSCEDDLTVQNTNSSRERGVSVEKTKVTTRDRSLSRPEKSSTPNQRSLGSSGEIGSVLLNLDYKQSVSLINSLEAEDLSNAIAQLLQSTDSKSRSLTNRAFDRLCRLSPGSAVKEVNNIPHGKAKDNLILTVAGSIALHHPQDPYKYLGGLEGISDSKKDAIVVNSLAGKSPDFLKELRSEVNSESYQKLVGIALGRSFADSGIEYNELVQKLDGGSSPIVINSWVLAKSAINSKSLVNEIVRGVIPSQLINDHVDIIAANYSADDPKSAALFLLEYGDGSHVEKSLSGIVESWTQQNTEQAGNWVNSLPNNDHKDFARLGIVRYLLSSSEVDLAKEWMDSIANKTIQNQANSLLEIYE